MQTVIDLTGSDESPRGISPTLWQDETPAERSWGSLESASTPQASRPRLGHLQNYEGVITRPFTSHHNSPSTPQRVKKAPYPKKWASDPRFNRKKPSKLQSDGSPERMRERNIEGTTPIQRASGSVPVLPMEPNAEPSRHTTYTFPSQMTPGKVHRELREKIHEQLSPKMLGLGLGRVYIAQDPKRPHLFKIGSTQNTAQRGQQLNRKCNQTSIIRESTISYVYYARAESLAQKDLAHLQRIYVCECGTRHTDRFEVSFEQALETLQRWEGFMQHRPYNATGSLKAVWKYLLSNRGISEEDEWDHETRWEYWEYILNPPTRFDYWEYLFPVVTGHPIWWFLWLFSWQVSSVFSWAVTLLVWRNRFTFSVFLMAVVCAGLSISSGNTVDKKKTRRFVAAAKRKD
ncbi:hypothetical protein P154DRAFT_521131 [Amniculicola lignicola CBS 123094]|uniref:Bacteriophage T5 Orf172 DNA-binding domain-containing protein n=1 Tax=Amniculicola lignicola CBS 123094 TaxID=1392246 RepID=A0A6A5WTC4_9PLEO|nr:hypothetical protein P154DRAFT_521131 [Amniculicola lignicola CBS 123094]